MEELIYSIDWEQVKNRFDIFMWGDPSIPIVKAAWANIAIAAVGLIMSVAQSMSAKKRRQKAMNEYKQSKAAFEAQDITNPYKDLENPYEDLTVNQKQAQFMAQQTQQGLANQMQALRGAAGASGISSLAQSIANQRTRSLQGISGTIGQQEAQNERLKAQGALQTKLAKAQGEQQMEMFQAQKAGTMLGMAQANVAGATMQQQAAMGGIAYGVGGLGGAIEGHVEQQQLKTDIKTAELPIDNVNMRKTNTGSSFASVGGTTDYSAIEAGIQANYARGYNTELNKPLPRSDGLIVEQGGRFQSGYYVGNNPGTYTVKPPRADGTTDTLFSIAAITKIDIDLLRRWNNIGADNTIYPGQILTLTGN